MRPFGKPGRQMLARRRQRLGRGDPAGVEPERVRFFA
jgi:hypothetical protein